MTAPLIVKSLCKTTQPGSRKTKNKFNLQPAPPKLVPSQEYVIREETVQSEHNLNLVAQKTASFRDV